MAERTGVQGPDVPIRGLLLIHTYFTRGAEEDYGTCLPLEKKCLHATEFAHIGPWQLTGEGHRDGEKYWSGLHELLPLRDHGQACRPPRAARFVVKLTAVAGEWLGFAALSMAR